MMKINREVFCIIIFGLTFSLINPQVSIADTSGQDTLVIRDWADSTHLDGRISDIPSIKRPATQYAGYLGMIAPGETTVIMPGVAESWTHNEERTEWTFTIREDAKFHDGTNITAKDVKYSLYANLMARWGSPFVNLSFTVSKVAERNFFDVRFPANDPEGEGQIVTIIQDSSDIIWWNVFHGHIPPMFEFSVCGAGYFAWFFQLVPYGSHGGYQDTTEVCQEKLDSFMQSPVSAGPYKLIEFEPGDHILMERFDDWFGWGETFTASNGKDYTFPMIENAFKYIRTEHESPRDHNVTDIQTGEVDIIPYVGGVDEGIDGLIKLNNTKDLSTVIKPTLESVWMNLNIQGSWPEFWGGPGNFPLTEVWFRQAISHALNRSKFNEDGLGYEYNSFYPDWILNDYSNIDNSDYYNFDQGKSKAISILDSNNYTPLGFPDEPDNRFGWGADSTETTIDGVEQSKGRHFKLITFEDMEIEANLIKQELLEVGIYIDVETTNLFDLGYSPGILYNTTYIDEPDPNFIGPDWDFIMGHYFYHFIQTPVEMFNNFHFGGWLSLGGMAGLNSGWYNPSFEKALAKALGRNETLIDIPGAEVINVNFPEWSNEDEQYTQACEDAGFEISRELPSIPLAWLSTAWVFDSHIKNFQCNSKGTCYLAYSYWEKAKSIPTLEFYYVLVTIFVILFIKRLKGK
ncbi:MAG: ABC transporter substrate-binding protein [Candidatus Hodarchaeales archaeon]|jgi:ABC-type transport system substrate-binding protein